MGRGRSHSVGNGPKARAKHATVYLGARVARRMKGEQGTRHTKCLMGGFSLQGGPTRSVQIGLSSKKSKESEGKLPMKGKIRSVRASSKINKNEKTGAWEPKGKT